MGRPSDGAGLALTERRRASGGCGYHCVIRGVLIGGVVTGVLVVQYETQAQDAQESFYSDSRRRRRGNHIYQQAHVLLTGKHQFSFIPISGAFKGEEIWAENSNTNVYSLPSLPHSNTHPQVPTNKEISSRPPQPVFEQPACVLRARRPTRTQKKPENQVPVGEEFFILMTAKERKCVTPLSGPPPALLALGHASAKQRQ